MTDATGVQASLPATTWLPRRQTTQLRDRSTLFVLRTHAGKDARAPVRFASVKMTGAFSFEIFLAATLAVVG